MKRSKKIFILSFSYIAVFIGVLLAAYYTSRTATVISENAPVENRKCIIIDPGHGGIDGGAVSCTGVPESQINLEIALKLDDLCHLLGLDTKMIRKTDCSVYTQGNSIAAQKVSDLKERVRIANSTENAIVVSIHQNTFADNRYFGGQVFYAPTTGSIELAKMIQESLNSNAGQISRRKAKKADGVYFMQHINCAGVLVECGFLSNSREETLLRDPVYQQKIACIIATACSKYLHTNQQAIA